MRRTGSPPAAEPRSPSHHPPARAPQLNETEERLLEKSLETALELESRLQDHERRAEAHRTEKAELGRRIASAFARGASSAAALATEVSDRLAERVTELMREFQRKTLHLNRQARLQRHPALRAPAPSSRTARERSGPPLYPANNLPTRCGQPAQDPELFMRVLQLQSSFLEGLDRRLVQGREKTGSVFETALAANAAEASSAASPHDGELSAGIGVSSHDGRDDDDDDF